MIVALLAVNALLLFAILCVLCAMERRQAWADAQMKAMLARADSDEARLRDLVRDVKAQTLPISSAAFTVNGRTHEPIRARGES